ncbi:phage major capsid protein [Sporosarcina sp. OR05]|uniref:phage major capsid protein n=1 Tax=Sporosarcina sp. OR05 TaxID=2969819 RepID=UPI003529FFA1
MKKRLLALLAKKEERKKALGENGAKTESVEELRSINAELDTLNGEIAELRGMINELPEEDDEPQQRSQPAGGQPVGGVNVLGTYGGVQRQQQQERSVDKYDTAEYRSAFMDYVTKGTKSDQLEFRADATTGVGDVGAVIPTTILNKIVEKLKDFGMIYSRVTKTGVQGGVQIPVSNAKPKATWVAAGTMSDKQKKTLTGTISFTYHKLQCRVAVELVAGTVAMPVFEQTITQNIYEAMIVAIEEAIISGTGTGQPLGITKDTTIPASQIVEVSPEELGKYDTWTMLFGKVPRAYRGGNVLIMADPDWTKYIEGMVDANGQPVARVTYGLDGTTQEKLIGKDVLPVEDYLPSIDDAVAGEVIGIICKLSDYMFNANMQLTFKRYYNEETDEWVSKSTLIADGKLADPNGVVLIKKKTVV